jgi:hypothetical protein
LELTQLQQGFVTDGMGFRVKLRGSNIEPPMSALGQKQTLAHVRVMSALPPKVDIYFSLDHLICAGKIRRRTDYLHIRWLQERSPTARRYAVCPKQRR